LTKSTTGYDLCSIKFKLSGRFLRIVVSFLANVKFFISIPRNLKAVQNKLKLEWSFLSYQLNSNANPAHLSVFFWPVWPSPTNVLFNLNFLHIFFHEDPVCDSIFSFLTANFLKGKSLQIPSIYGKPEEVTNCFPGISLALPGFLITAPLEATGRFSP
jgi:hypothetical protein